MYYKKFHSCSFLITKLRNQVFKMKGHFSCLRALKNLEPDGFIFWSNFASPQNSSCTSSRNLPIPSLLVLAQIPKWLHPRIPRCTAKGWCCNGRWAGSWMVGRSNTPWIPLCFLAGCCVRREVQLWRRCTPFPPSPFSPLPLGQRSRLQGGSRGGGFPPPSLQAYGTYTVDRVRSLMFLSIFNKLGENYTILVFISAI